MKSLDDINSVVYIRIFLKFVKVLKMRFLCKKCQNTITIFFVHFNLRKYFFRKFQIINCNKLLELFGDQYGNSSEQPWRADCVHLDSKFIRDSPILIKETLLSSCTYN